LTIILLHDHGIVTTVIGHNHNHHAYYSYRGETDISNTEINKTSYFCNPENAAQQDCPLHEAAKRGNVEFLKELLQMGVSANSLDFAGNSPLHCMLNH
jgi:ankyrin repeat protein